MNAEKLSKLQAQVRIGGKGTARRKKKIVHRTAMTDDKKLQSSLKKLSVNMITGIEEANIIKQDGTVIHFNNPKVQASLSANTFAISGQNETKQITEMLPSILNQLGADSLTHLRKLASDVQVAGSKKGSYNLIGGDSETSLTGGNVADDEDVPDLVGNFDDPSKTEGVTIKSGDSADSKADKAKETAEKTNEEKKANSHPEGQKEKADSEERKGREEKKESEKKNKDEKQQSKKEKNQ